MSGGCFTNVSRALQNNLAKIYNASNHIYGENFELKLCTCAQSMALGTRTKFQLEMLIGEVRFLQHTHFERIFWRALETIYIYIFNMQIASLCFLLFSAIYINDTRHILSYPFHTEGPRNSRKLFQFQSLKKWTLVRYRQEQTEWTLTPQNNVKYTDFDAF